MDSYYIIFAFLGFGVLLILIALLLKDRPKKEKQEELEISEKRSELSQLIDEADKMMQELHNFSDYIIKELEAKHKELLFLYQLVESKQKEVYQSSDEQKQIKVENPSPLAMHNTGIQAGIQTPAIGSALQAYASNKSMKTDENIDEDTLEQIMNRFFKEKSALNSQEPAIEEPEDEQDKTKKILRMHQNGYNVEQIAEMLHIGKGEVQLIIEFNKKGDIF